MNDIRVDVWELNCKGDGLFSDPPLSIIGLFEAIIVHLEADWALEKHQGANNKTNQ